MSDFLTIDDMTQNNQANNKTVLLRADLNVPMQNGVVSDASRLERLAPTLNDLKKAGAKIVVLSHFGRPDGKPNPKYSLKPVAAALETILQQPVGFAEDCVGPVAAAAVKALQPGQILVLENTRFHPGEESNDPVFAKQLASLGDVYINDAFSAAHRAHASTEALAHLLPAAAGRLMQAELEALAKALNHPQRPVAAIVGGSKISTKLDLLQNLIAKVDVLILGGGMANTFLASRGMRIGKSLCEPDMFETARAITEKAGRKCTIILPKDAVVAGSLSPNVATQTVSVEKVPADQMMLDLGPASVNDIKTALMDCKTVVWNGPLGAFETKPFDAATNAIARYVADLTRRGKILSVAGGGDTVSALANAGVSDGMSYLSAAGGAFLEWLEGKELPGVAVLCAAKAKIPAAKKAVM